MQGGKYGNALQAAVIGESQQIVKLLLDRGADVQHSVAGKYDIPLLHAPVASRNRTLLELLLIPTAAVLVNAPDFLGRTPVHLAATNGDVDMLEILSNFSQNSIDFNRQDIDGSTSLHCAVKNHASEAVEWLIDHGATVDVKDFTMTNPLQLASQLRNFRIFRLLLSKVTEIKMSASDFRKAIATVKRKQILLSRNEGGENTIQVMDYQEVVRHFDALSYPLGLSTSCVEERYAECITTLPVQQSILIFDRQTIPGKNTVIQNSPNGVHYRWWRKMKLEERGFLECNVVLPAYLPHESPIRLLPNNITSSKHIITWIMVKMDKDKADPLAEQQSLGPKIFFSTLEYAEIPRSAAELFDYCLRQLEQEWYSICHAAEEHLTQMRNRTLDSSGQDPKMIDQHLRDATTWASFDATQSQQAIILQELWETYSTSMWPYLKGTWSDQDRDMFQKEIEKAYARIRKRIARLTQMSQELINLEFSLTSIAEAQKSTSMNRSMKRLSWITFVFLPLVFVAVGYPEAPST
ncbi:ankyrin repeat-containing domain protein [Aspergillus nidulans var. acristatus]